MRILSIVAVSRLSERLVREAGGQVDHDDLLTQLDDLDIDVERATAGLRLAVTVGRLQVVEGADGPVLRARPVSTPSTTAKETQR